MAKDDSRKPERSKKTLLFRGLKIFAIGFVLNMVFMRLGIGGLLRELSRLTTIVGLVMSIVGLFVKFK